MAKHKWHKEICAWADGAVIEQTLEKASGWTDWHDVVTPTFYTSGAEFRIKPQPKEPKYLYVINNWGSLRLSETKELRLNESYVGKIKLEIDDDM